MTQGGNRSSWLGVTAISRVLTLVSKEEVVSRYSALISSAMVDGTSLWAGNKRRLCDRAP